MRINQKIAKSKHLWLVAILAGTIGIVAVGLTNAMPGGAGQASANPYTNRCPGNKIKYGVPKGKTATASARQNVFGKPYPHANVESIQFMGKNVTVNKKITPCLKAVEWDLKYKYKTKYKLTTIYGASEVSQQNPTKYFHPYGAAVDINPQENPQCRGGCPHKLPKTWVRAFSSHGFFWGGNFKVDKDYMHFEWHGQK